MSDQTFERDLARVLGDIAGSGAPLSLRERVARTIEQAPIPSRPWFASPWRLSFAGVGVVAVVAVAFLVSQSLPVVGPPPSASPGSPNPSASAPATTPSPMPSGSPGEPSPSATTPSPTPTQGPTAIPVTDWAGLRWSDGVPPPDSGPGTSLRVNDVLAWGDGYVAVGSLASGILEDGSDGPDYAVVAAFLTSPDGLHWTISQLGAPSTCGQADCAGNLVHVVSTGQVLVAIGFNMYPGGPAPLMWRSTDGRTWQSVDDATWNAAWGRATAIFPNSIAGGPEGFVAVGTPSVDWGWPGGAPVIVYSADGLTWTRIHLGTAFANAFLTNVAADAGGFVVVGATGEPDDPTSGTQAVRGPAAWVSTDGRTWRKASVPGKAGPDVGLTSVIVGTDGLFALGRRAGRPSTDYPSWVLPMSAWASTGGLTWRLIGDRGTDLPYWQGRDWAGDGSHMVLFGTATCKATALQAWSSTDGFTWTRLPFSGSTTIPAAEGNPECPNDGDVPGLGGYMAFARVVPAGVVIYGTNRDGGPALFWFGTATGP